MCGWLQSSTSNNPIVTTLKGVIQNLEVAQSVVSGGLFFAAIRQNNIGMQVDGHQDTGEFAQKLLEKLTSLIVASPFRHTQRRSIRCDNCSARHNTNGAVHEVYQLATPQSTSVVGLQSLIGVEERMDSNTRCNNCNTTGNVFSTQQVSRPSQVLVFDINRVNNTQQQAGRQNVKITTRIGVPLELSIEDTNNVGQSIDYDLKSVVVHIGDTPTMGHYVTLFNRWRLD